MIADIVRHHVTLEVRCIDRLDLHASMPKLQTSRGLCYFLQEHRGHPIPSPALFKPLHDRFVTGVQAFAQRHGIPLIAFESKQRKDDVVADYRRRFTGREGVVVTGMAQEKMRSFKAQKRHRPDTKVTFDLSRQSVAVNHYCCYVHDRDWGPAFLRIGAYLPHPVKVCLNLNGHEWVKQHIRRQRVRVESLDNGFLRCAAAAALQATCDALSPAGVQAFFDRWSHRLPWSTTPADHTAGYDHRLAICQLKVCLPHVFDRPVQGGHFFEAVIREHLDLRLRPLPAAPDLRHATAHVRLPHARHHRWGAAESPRHVEGLARASVFRCPDDRRPAVPPPQGPDPPDSEDLPLHRDQLRAQSAFPLRQALSRILLRTGPRCGRTTTACRDCCAPTLDQLDQEIPKLYEEAALVA